MIALNPHLSFLVAALGTLLLTGMVYFVDRRFEWLDHPIGRSSHTVATPTSGGLALALVLPAVAWMHTSLNRPHLHIPASRHDPLHHSSIS